jgi:hypothetical protein
VGATAVDPDLLACCGESARSISSGVPNCTTISPLTTRPREGFLPECTFRGQQNARLQYAVLAAAAVHGGTEPDLIDEVGSWLADDFWQYAMYAAVAYIRAAASRAGVPVRQACEDLGERPSHPPHITAAVAAALAVREQKQQAGRRSGLPGYPGVSHRGSRRANLPATPT